MKKNVSELRSLLLNKEMSFTMLDSIMHKICGYYPLRKIYEDGIIKDIKDYLTAVYTAVDSATAEVQIYFEITKDSELDENEENFYLKITDIQEF